MLGNQLKSSGEGGVLVTGMVGIAIENNLLGKWPDSEPEPFLKVTLGEQIEANRNRRRDIGEKSQLHGAWFKTAPDPEIIAYYDRLMAPSSWAFVLDNPITRGDTATRIMNAPPPAVDHCFHEWFCPQFSFVLIFALLIAFSQNSHAATDHPHLKTVITNLAMLHRIAQGNDQTDQSLILEGTVCVVSERKDSFVLVDRSGAAQIRLDFGNSVLKPGEYVHLEGDHCTLRYEGSGILISGPLLDNDGIHEAVEQSWTVPLKKGMHPFRLSWFNLLGNYGLKLEYEGPNLSRQVIPDAVFFTKEGESESARSRQGLEYRCYEGTWRRLPRFDLLYPVKTGITPRIDLEPASRREQVAIVFAGFLQISQEGLYTFHLNSDDGAQLLIGAPPISLKSFGTRTVPPAQNLLELKSAEKGSDAFWAYTEGRVSFVSQRSSGLEIDLVTGGRHVRVELADSSGSSPRLLHNSRIRAIGLARSALTIDGSRAASVISILSWRQIELVEVESLLWARKAVSLITNSVLNRETDPSVHLRGVVNAVTPGESILIEDLSGRAMIRSTQTQPAVKTGQTIEVLGAWSRDETNVLQESIYRIPETEGSTSPDRLFTSADDIQHLTREEAKRGHRVKLRGVVTSVLLPFLSDFVLQDAGRGIYMFKDPTGLQDPPQIGDALEIEGITESGDFSPIVKVETMTRLGSGQLPEPRHPRWTELMNGSLDAQFFELHGIVTAVGWSQIDLLMPEGKIRIEIGTDPERLKNYENAQIRLRGCLFARWDGTTGLVQPRELWFREAWITLDQAAPADLFDAPAKRPSDLLRFDPNADAFQRIKVSGQIIYAAAPVYVLSDGTNGVHLLTGKPVVLRVGDNVDAVGFPDITGSSLTLREAVTRTQNNSALPEAIAVSARDLGTREHDSTRVRIEGRLEHISGLKGEQILEVLSDSRRFLARLRTNEASFISLKIDSELQLTGTYVAQEINSDQRLRVFELLLNSPADVRVLSRPSWWNIKHTGMLMGMMATVLLGTMTWINTLRREVKSRTRALNAEMEDRKEAEQEAKEARDIANAASRSKSVFLATMSHEIRTPMNAIIGMNNLLLDTELRGDQRELATIVKTSSEGLLRIISDILDFSKVEAGKLTFESVPFNFRELVENVTAMLKENAQAKGLRIVTRISSNHAMNFLGDATRIQQVLLNLLSNAIKFSEAGDIVVLLEAESMPEERTALKVSVTDSGIGISHLARERLFRPFEQENDSTTRKYGGTGLGLAISKRLIETMHGKLDFESEVGRGSTFWFTIELPNHAVTSATQTPGQQTERAVAPKIDPSESAKNHGRRHLKILVAEDNPVNQRVISLQLKKLGYTAELASNGREAFEASKNNSYDIILMDCQMPEMDGYEVTRNIRKIEKHHTRIIAMTANAMEGDRGKCLAAGMDEYLTKPINMAALKKVLDQVSDEIQPA
jgi:signal transduction histidine kinase/ActR/RegA family two-component response regulator